MDSSGILSFSTETAQRQRVDAHPSPTLELIYAYHRLTRTVLDEDEDTSGEGARQIEDLFHELRETHPELVDRVRQVCGEDGADRYDVELFLLALEFDFADGEDPRAFLDALPDLPTRYLERSAEDPSTGPSQAEHRRKSLDRVQRLADGGRATEIREVLARLWSVLEPRWRSDGRAVARAAAEHFLEAFDAKGDVLSALPPHHFAQFEASAERIRAAQARNQIDVIPLYFASQGGFIFNVHDAWCIGYGLQTEQAFADTEARVRDIAARMKAYADPTRLMLLTLLARYGRLTPTVGDLASQLGVSQPTVSGHLRLLRDAGLVRLEKDGTKSFYHLQTDAAIEPLDELSDLLAQSRKS